VRRVLNLGLEAFTCWFASGAGVGQTTVVVVVVAAAELARPSLDPHGFWLLWALTLFSAVTQPALAYSGSVQARKTDALLARIEQLEETLLERIGAPNGQ
jgi:hypothetical protein